MVIGLIYKATPLHDLPARSIHPAQTKRKGLSALGHHMCLQEFSSVSIYSACPACDWRVIRLWQVMQQHMQREALQDADRQLESSEKAERARLQARTHSALNIASQFHDCCCELVAGHKPLAGKFIMFLIVMHSHTGQACILTVMPHV